MSLYILYYTNIILIYQPPLISVIRRKNNAVCIITDLNPPSLLRDSQQSTWLCSYYRRRDRLRNTKGNIQTIYHFGFMNGAIRMLKNEWLSAYLVTMFIFIFYPNVKRILSRKRNEGAERWVDEISLIIFGRISNVRNARRQNDYAARWWRLLWIVARTLWLTCLIRINDLCMKY